MDYYYITPCEYFTPALADGRSLESEWQQVSSRFHSFSTVFWLGPVEMAKSAERQILFFFFFFRFVNWLKVWSSGSEWVIRLYLNTPKNFMRFIFSNGFCGTMWVVRLADDLFVCFGAKPKQKAWTARPEAEEERKVREKTGMSWQMNPERAVDNGQQKRSVGVR